MTTVIIAPTTFF